MHGKAFEPLRVNQMELRNRIVRTAHGVRLSWSDGGGDQIAYHVARAKGGVAMAIIGIGGVHATSPTVIPLHEDRVIPGLRKIADAVHEHGMKLVHQIWHGGSTKPNYLGGAPWSSSPVAHPTVGVVPVAMTKPMIDEVVEAFAKAAVRVKMAGLDGVEIHGANGYLVNQFLSPAFNHRADDYGGSLENRLRFVREILDAVRSVVGPDFTVGLRLSSTELIEHGLLPADAAEIACALEPKIDYLNVSFGTMHNPEKITAPMNEPMGYQLDSSAVVTREVSVPTIVTGRIMTMDMANHIVESGVSDLVSMVRGLIADPEIVNKSRDNRAAEIRPCIGTNLCVGSTVTGTFACTVNPSAGNEVERPLLEGTPPVAVPRRVLIAGGGPAGMECARSAALRGHDVTLYELRRELGGQVTMAARAPARGDLAAITHWQADELARIGVKVVLRAAVDPDVVAELSPDVLVLATGSTPRTDGIQLARPATPLPGIDLPHVYTSWDLLGSGRRPDAGTSALVFDDTGEFEPLAVACELAARGVSITFVTRFDGMGERILGRDTILAPTLFQLTDVGIRIITRSHLEEITPGHVAVRSDGGQVVHTVEADSVFFIGVNAPNRELAEYLTDFPGEVHQVGDAAGFHTLARAIHDGDALGRAI